MAGLCNLTSAFDSAAPHSTARNDARRAQAEHQWHHVRCLQNEIALAQSVFQ